ncbi:Uncharacterised protein [Mycobacteroides abscessus subsp. abscessus]|nr:Uncharacterised protein [Mycobacteroides abscessus subsp. abscessus]
MIAIPVPPPVPLRALTSAMMPKMRPNRPNRKPPKTVTKLIRARMPRTSAVIAMPLPRGDSCQY